MSQVEAGNHVNQKKRKCSYCDMINNPGNIARHEKACARRSTSHDPRTGV
jgi:hypothetical protein